MKNTNRMIMLNAVLGTALALATYSMSHASTTSKISTYVQYTQPIAMGVSAHESVSR